MKAAVIIGIVLLVVGFAAFMLIAMQTPAERVDTTMPQLAVRYSAAESLTALSADELAMAREEGQAIYQRFQCIGCHMDQGSALKKLERIGNKYNVATLKQYLKRPNLPMPVFPLSDADREHLAIYLIERYPGSENQD